MRLLTGIQHPVLPLHYLTGVHSVPPCSPYPAILSSRVIALPASTHRGGIPERDLYAMLGLRGDATREQIDAAFAALGKRASYREYAEIHEILTHPGRRSTYDLGRQLRIVMRCGWGLHDLAVPAAMALLGIDGSGTVDAPHLLAAAEPAIVTATAAEAAAAAVAGAEAEAKTGASQVLVTAPSAIEEYQHQEQQQAGGAAARREGGYWLSGRGPRPAFRPISVRSPAPMRAAFGSTVRRWAATRLAMPLETLTSVPAAKSTPAKALGLADGAAPAGGLDLLGMEPAGERVTQEGTRPKLVAAVQREELLRRLGIGEEDIRGSGGGAAGIFAATAAGPMALLGSGPRWQSAMAKAATAATAGVASTAAAEAAPAPGASLSGGQPSEAPVEPHAAAAAGVEITAEIALNSAVPFGGIDEWEARHRSIGEVKVTEYRRAGAAADALEDSDGTDDEVEEDSLPTAAAIAAMVEEDVAVSSVGEPVVDASKAAETVVAAVPEAPGGGPPTGVSAPSEASEGSGEALMPEPAAGWSRRASFSLRLPFSATSDDATASSSRLWKKPAAAAAAAATATTSAVEAAPAAVSAFRTLPSSSYSHLDGGDGARAPAMAAAADGTDRSTVDAYTLTPKVPQAGAWASPAVNYLSALFRRSAAVAGSAAPVPAEAAVAAVPAEAAAAAVPAEAAAAAGGSWTSPAGAYLDTLSRQAQPPPAAANFASASVAQDAPAAARVTGAMAVADAAFSEAAVPAASAFKGDAAAEASLAVPTDLEEAASSATVFDALAAEAAEAAPEPDAALAATAVALELEASPVLPAKEDTAFYPIDDSSAVAAAVPIEAAAVELSAAFITDSEYLDAVTAASWPASLLVTAAESVCADGDATAPVVASAVAATAADASAQQAKLQLIETVDSVDSERERAAAAFLDAATAVIAAAGDAVKEITDTERHIAAEAFAAAGAGSVMAAMDYSGVATVGHSRCEAATFEATAANMASKEIEAMADLGTITASDGDDSHQTEKLLLADATGTVKSFATNGVVRMRAAAAAAAKVDGGSVSAVAGLAALCGVTAEAALGVRSKAGRAAARATEWSREPRRRAPAASMAAAASATTAATTASSFSVPLSVMDGSDFMLLPPPGDWISPLEDAADAAGDLLPLLLLSTALWVATGTGGGVGIAAAAAVRPALLGVDASLAVAAAAAALGASLAPGELAVAWRRQEARRGVAVALVTSYIVMPALAAVIGGVLRLDAASRLGLLLVAAAGGAPAAGILSWVGGADVATAAAAAVANSLAVSAVLPLVARAVAPAAAAAAGGSGALAACIAAATARLLLVPLVLGAALRAAVAAKLPAAEEALPPAAQLVGVGATCALAAVAFHGARAAAATAAASVHASVVLLHALGAAAAFALARAAGAGGASARAAAAEASLKGSAAALVLARLSGGGAAVEAAAAASLLWTAALGSVAAVLGKHRAAAGLSPAKGAA